MRGWIWLLAVMLGGRALSHPHAWVDVLLTPQVTAAREIVALDMRWRFDPFYAQVMLEEVQAAESEAAFAARWAALEADINRTLREADFYLATDAALGEGRGTLRVADGELFLEVHLPLRKAVSSLHYRIYEPTYYVEMLHDAAQPRAWGNGCRLHLAAANPAPEKVAAAYALDRNGQGEAELGRYFAESAELSCQ